MKKNGLYKILFFRLTFSFSLHRKIFWNWEDIHTHTHTHKIKHSLIFFLSLTSGSFVSLQLNISIGYTNLIPETEIFYISDICLYFNLIVEAFMGSVKVKLRNEKLILGSEVLNFLWGSVSMTVIILIIRISTGRSRDVIVIYEQRIRQVRSDWVYVHDTNIVLVHNSNICI